MSSFKENYDDKHFNLLKDKDLDSNKDEEEEFSLTKSKLISLTNASKR